MDSICRKSMDGFIGAADCTDAELQDHGFACASRTRRDGLADLLAPTALPQNKQQPARKVAVSDLWFGLSDEIVDSIIVKGTDSPSEASNSSNFHSSNNRRRKVGMADLFHYPGADIRHLNIRASVDKHDGA